MLGQLFDLILYPVQELLKLLDDPRITSYLGVSLIGCIVTLMIMFIVIRALVNPSAMGISLNLFQTHANRYVQTKSNEARSKDK